MYLNVHTHKYICRLIDPWTLFEIVLRAHKIQFIAIHIGTDIEFSLKDSFVW